MFVREAFGRAGRPAALCRLGILAGYAGLLGGIPFIPAPLRLGLLALFVLAGPGSVLLTWFPDLPPFAVWALVPLSGSAVCILIVTGLLGTGIYRPDLVLLGLAVGTLAGATARLLLPHGGRGGAP